MVSVVTFFALSLQATAVDLAMFKPENLLIIEVDSPASELGDADHGKVVILMRPDVAPKHVARISELAGKGFYDGIIFHRVIDGFMAQTGDPDGNGTGGSGYNLKAEFNKVPHLRGTASMARAGDPDSGDSQFFICLSRAASLDSNYTVWGRVIVGMDHVDSIPLGEPAKNPGKMVSVRVASQIADWKNTLKTIK